MDARNAEQVLDPSLLLDKLGVGLPCLYHLELNHGYRVAGTRYRMSSLDVSETCHHQRAWWSRRGRVYHIGLSLVVCQISGAPLEAAAYLPLFTSVLTRFGISALHDAGWRRVFRTHMVGVRKFVMRRADNCA